MEDADVVMEDVGAPERQDFGPPQPPEPFPAPVIRPAYRGQRLRVNGRNCHRFWIHLESGELPVLAYLRCEYSHNPGYAYVKFESVESVGSVESVEVREPRLKKHKKMGNDTTVFRAQWYKRVADSGCETVADSGKYRDTGRTVTIKKVRKPQRKSYTRDDVRIVPENVRAEVSVAQNFGDDVHILRMIEALEDNEYYYMVIPDLGKLPMPSRRAPPHLNLNLLRTLVKNLVYLQKHGIIHRDLSPDNVTCDGPHCPIIGFALALQCCELQGNWLPIPPDQDVCGAPSHRSFEVVRRQALDFGVDVWALGCTLFRLWTGEPLYEQPGDGSWDLFFDEVDIFLNAPQFNLVHPDVPPDIRNAVPPDFIQEFIIAHRKIRLVREALSVEQRGLLSFMLNTNRRIRISAEGILGHAILAQI